MEYDVCHEKSKPAPNFLTADAGFSSLIQGDSNNGKTSERSMRSPLDRCDRSFQISFRTQQAPCLKGYTRIYLYTLALIMHLVVKKEALRVGKAGVWFVFGK